DRGLVSTGVLKAVLVGVWTAAEYPEACLGRWMWVRFFREAGYPRPRHSRTVSRGAPPHLARGMSWTTRRTKAEWFAGRGRMNPGNAGAFVYTVDVPREA